MPAPTDTPAPTGRDTDHAHGSTSPQPTPEAIEAGARAMVLESKTGPYKGWPVPPVWAAPRYVRAALTAALPAIRAQVLAEVAEVADELDQLATTWHEATGGYPEKHAYNDGRAMSYEVAADLVRDLANPTPAAKEAGL